MIKEHTITGEASTAKAVMPDCMFNMQRRPVDRLLNYDHAVLSTGWGEQVVVYTAEHLIVILITIMLKAKRSHFLIFLRMKRGKQW